MSALIAIVRVLAAVVVLAGILPSQERVNAASALSAFNTQAQTACETEMLHRMGAHQVFSGKGYEVLTEVARAYSRVTPHMYISPEV